MALVIRSSRRRLIGTTSGGMARAVELTPSPRNLLVGLWQILGLETQGMPGTWTQASEICESFGMGKVSLTNDESHGRWTIECGEAGAMLRVVVKESAAMAASHSTAFNMLPNPFDSVGHCYTLRPAPAANSAGTDWRREISLDWATAWAAERLSPVQQLLVPRITDGSSLMMDAATTQAQAVQAVLHAPLDQVSSFLRYLFD
eukprot:COSAG02_NODE_1195_length_13940_cov_15.482407_5_plen_203_part_00